VGALHIFDRDGEVLVLVQETPESLSAAFDAVRAAAEQIERSDSPLVEVAIVVPGPLTTSARFVVRALTLQAEARGKTVRIWPQPAAS